MADPIAGAVQNGKYHRRKTSGEALEETDEVTQAVAAGRSHSDEVRALAAGFGRLMRHRISNMVQSGLHALN
jgi:hypothetical protein